MTARDAAATRAPSAPRPHVGYLSCRRRSRGPGDRPCQDASSPVSQSTWAANPNLQAGVADNRADLVAAFPSRDRHELPTMARAGSRGSRMILLAQGESVTGTASLCGWSTTSAFIDRFRRAMGQTPGAYRDLATG
jgi:hypothetical protein